MNLFHYKAFAISYETVGTGSKPLLAFHGFGKTASELAKALNQTHLVNTHTVYCIDFFFHGQSVYPEDRIARNKLTKDEYAALISAFCQKNNLTKVSLFGYSLGGKLCMILAEKQPNLIHQVYLLAPDGLKKIWWYHWVAKFPPFRWTYKYYITKPYWYFWWMNLLEKTRILHPKVVRFANDQMSTKAQRLRIYRVWMIMQNLEPDFTILAEKTKEHKISFLLFLGKYDQVIRSENVKRFKKILDLPEKSIRLLEAGHQLMRPEHLKIITRDIQT